MITVLCTDKNSVYKDLGLDCYDVDRNCRTFTGLNPVITHSPCRGWTRFGKAMNAKPKPGEKDLSYFCLERVIINGGVFEHPYESEFAIRAGEIPGIKTIIVKQEWFGYFCPKKTRLLIPTHYIVPELPFILVPRASSSVRNRDWAISNRQDTCIGFAKWLIKLVEINNEESK